MQRGAPSNDGASPSWPGIQRQRALYIRNMVKKIRTFFQEVRAEMQKVTWSTREELMGSTAVVLTTMLILSVFIGIADFIFSSALHAVLR